MRISGSTLVMVVVVVLSGLATSEACREFWRNLARARISNILSSFPELIDEIKNGQLGPRPNPFNNQNGFNNNQNGLNNNPVSPNGLNNNPVSPNGLNNNPVNPNGLNNNPINPNGLNNNQVNPNNPVNPNQQQQQQQPNQNQLPVVPVQSSVSNEIPRIPNANRV